MKLLLSPEFFLLFSTFVDSVNSPSRRTEKELNCWAQFLSIACPDFQPTFYSRAELRMVACSYKIRFFEIKLQPLIYILSLVALSLWQPCRVVLTETRWPTSLTFSEKVCWAHNQNKGGWNGIAKKFVYFVFAWLII